MSKLRAAVQDWMGLSKVLVPTKPAHINTTREPMVASVTQAQQAQLYARAKKSGAMLIAIPCIIVATVLWAPQQKQESN